MESTVAWIPFVGIVVALVSVGLALAGLILATMRSIRAEIREIRAEMRELSVRVSRLEQSQAHTAGLIEGIRDSLFDRAGRVGAGERVAESAESYNPQGATASPD